MLGGPAPLKLMAARGLAPLKPLELATVLYQLATTQGDADAAVRAAAEKSAAELPEKILAPAFADPAIDPRVLDYFAPRVLNRPPLLDAILLNRSFADDSAVALTPRLGERELEMIAVNEQRLLRAPGIIAALYLNPRARMSTVDKAIELAVRHNIQVAGIPRWDDLVQAVLGQKEPPKPAAVIDATFAAVAKVAVGDEPAPLPSAVTDDDLEVVNAQEEVKVDEVKKELPIDQLTVAQKIRLATLGNGYARAILIRDPIKMVALAAVNSPGMTDQEIMKFSANRALADDVIRVIANTKEWTKMYQVKNNLVNNPKTPLPMSMRFLPFLHEKDLRNLARSKAIPSALAAQAKKLVSQKGSH